MLFIYQAIDAEGQEKKGTIEAISLDVAISSLQRRGFVISYIDEAETEGSIITKNIAFFDRVSNKDVVILSRQMATLFASQISALRTFNMLASETENPKLSRKLADISESLQGGSTISDSLAKHPDVFTPFYISMVKAGEESGKLDQTFEYLADYLDRTYEVTQKAKGALVYPAFVIFTFIVVMVLMLTLVIPKIGAILVDSGQDVPSYTKFVMGLSSFFVDYGAFLVIGLVVAFFFLFRFVRTNTGKESFDKFKLEIPYIGALYKKLYLSRIADNIDTMLASGIPVVKALELTRSVVDNKVYLDAIEKSTETVKGGIAVSDAFSKFPEQFPNIFIQMMRVGEESGNLGNILSSLSKFYRREVTNAVDTLVSLIEPVMIILLALGVGTLLASVLIPIYNISATF